MMDDTVTRVRVLPRSLISRTRRMALLVGIVMVLVGGSAAQAGAAGGARPAGDDPAVVTDLTDVPLFVCMAATVTELGVG